MDKKQLICEAVERKAPLILSTADQIWSFAELAFHEDKSSALLEDVLEQEGFRVERGLPSLKTAFCASYGHGRPKIALLAEYDALPALSQTGGCTHHAPVQEGGSGHGCGHHALGTGMLAAALGVKAYLDAHDIEGTICVVGCPAEENGASKMILSRAGYFDQFDIAMSWHPDMRNGVRYQPTLATIDIDFEFTGVGSHAAMSPHLGRSALDASQLMCVGANYLREHMPKGCLVHYAYSDAGGSAANVVQAHTVMRFILRAPWNYMLDDLRERLMRIAKGAGLMTDVQVGYKIRTGVDNIIVNRTLNDVVQGSLEEIGAPAFDEEDFALARRFMHEAYPPELQASFRESYRRKWGAEAEQVLENGLDTRILYLNDPSDFSSSSDVGDVSNVIPTCWLCVACWTVETTNHSWQATAQGPTSIAHKGILCAGKTLALSAVKLMEQPELVEKARQELFAITGGKYVGTVPLDLDPQNPPDFRPVE